MQLESLNRLSEACCGSDRYQADQADKCDAKDGLIERKHRGFEQTERDQAIAKRHDPLNHPNLKSVGDGLASTLFADHKIHRGLT